MSARPGRLQARINVGLKRPRTIEDTTSEEFNAMKREILRQIRH
jgi:NitT/TauT family transport system ATP-binding protein